MTVMRIFSVAALLCAAACSSDSSTPEVVIDAGGSNDQLDTSSSDTSSSSDSLVTDEDSTTAADSEDCEAQCEGRVCGDDGCGGTCGNCGEGTQCDEAGQCVCEPSCDEQECGDDGCGGSCGSCGDINDPCLDGACEDGQCIESPIEGSCDDGDPCTVADACVEGACLGNAKDCDDDNPCTLDGCAEGACSHSALNTAECALTVTIDNPIRAAVKEELTTLVVQGTVSSPAAVIDHVSINGVDVAVLANGSFSTLIPNPVAGLTIIEVTAENALGQIDSTAHSVLASEAFNPVNAFNDNAPLDEIMSLWLSATAFDDNDRSDVDDFTTLAWMFFETVDKEAIIPSPLYQEGEEPSFLGCTYDDATLSNLDFKIDDATITPADGELTFDFEIDDFSVYVDLKSDDLFGACPDAIGTLSAEKLEVNGAITLSVDLGTPSLSVTPDQLQVIVYGLEMELDEGALSILPNGLVNWLLGAFEERIIEEFKFAVVDALIPALNGLIVSFTSYDRQVLLPSVIDGGIPTPLSVSLRVGEAQISSDGLSLKVAGGTSTEPTLPQQLVDKMPGSFSGVDCDSGQSLDEKLTKTSIVEALIDVDLVNQVLHGLWTSGYTHLTLTKDTLGELLDEPLLANATIVLAPDLPVVMTTCSEQGDVTFEIGDLLADISFGPDNAVTTYISMSASADLGVIAVPDAPDVLGLNSLNIERLALDIQSTEGLDFVDMEGLRELLTTLITEQLAGDFMVSLLDGLLRGLPLPTVALETLLPELEEGSDLGFEPSVLNSDGRHILLGGELVPPDAVNAPTP